MHGKGLQSEKAKSPHQRELLCPVENTAPTLPETPGLESSLYLCNLCESLCNRRYKYLYIYTYIMYLMYLYIYYKIYTFESVSRHTVATAIVALF